LAAAVFSPPRFLNSAHRRFAAIAIALRPAADILRFRGASGAAAVFAVAHLRFCAAAIFARVAALKRRGLAGIPSGTKVRLA
jgi:hypothetical protein